MKHLAAVLAAAAAVALAPSAHAQTSGSLGLGVGVVKPKDIDSTVWFTGTLRLPLSANLALEPEIGYWKKTAEEGAAKASLEDLHFGGSALLVFPSERVEIFVGGGAGAHRLKGKLGVFGVGIDRTETKLGLHILGGIDIRASDSLTVFGAARWERIRLGDEDDGDDDLDTTKFYGGLRFRL